MNPVPLLIIAYRRHDFLAQLIASIPCCRPLYIVVDGPGCKAHEQDVAITQGVVSTLAQTRPDTYLLLRSSNLGGPIGIPAAIDWVLEREELVCILEEDCIPSPLAFPYIDRIRGDVVNNSLVAGATLNNFVAPRLHRSFRSPFLSVFPHCWGWLTYRSSWDNLRPSPDKLKDWNPPATAQRLEKVLSSTFPDDSTAQLYWRSVFKDLLGRTVYHWDYAYTLNLWDKGLRFIAPPCNLVSNIGTDNRSQNCKSASPNHMLTFPVSLDDSASIGLLNDLDVSYSYEEFDRTNQALVFGHSQSLLTRVAGTLPCRLRDLVMTLMGPS